MVDRTKRIGDRAASRRAARYLGAVVLVVVAAAALLAARHVLSSGSFVAGMEVENRSAYALELRLSGHERGGWMPVGTAQPNTVTTFEDVYDQGPTWVLEFAIGPERAAITVSRSDLRRAGWHVRVPEELIERLRRGRTSP
jgi:hypothetical protein